MRSRSDVDEGLEERRRRADWPSERFLLVDFAMQIATQFEQERERQGLSYEDVAQKAGTSKAHVIRLLSGTYAGISNRSLAKLCHALRCQLKIELQSVADQRATASRHGAVWPIPKAVQPARAVRPAAAPLLVLNRSGR